MWDSFDQDPSNKCLIITGMTFSKDPSNWKNMLNMDFNFKYLQYQLSILWILRIRCGSKFNSAIARKSNTIFDNCLIVTTYVTKEETSIQCFFTGSFFVKNLNSSDIDIQILLIIFILILV